MASGSGRVLGYGRDSAAADQEELFLLTPRQQTNEIGDALLIYLKHRPGVT
jgi:hypothetical protein